MKKSTLARLGGLAMVLCLATMALFGGSLAKYTSTIAGNGTGTVAKWDFKVNGYPSDFTFDLFGEDGATIQPGSSGEFAIKLDNASDVDATYAITFTAEGDETLPIKYAISTSGTAPEDESAWKDSISGLDIVPSSIPKTNGSVTQTVYWKWAYDADGANDTAETTVAKSDERTVSVTATVTGTQVDPNAQQ